MSLFKRNNERTKRIFQFCYFKIAKKKNEIRSKKFSFSISPLPQSKRNTNFLLVNIYFQFSQFPKVAFTAPCLARSLLVVVWVYLDINFRIFSPHSTDFCTFPSPSSPKQQNENARNDWLVRNFN